MYTFICYPKSIFLIFFRVSTKESNSRSVVVKLTCAELSLLQYNAMGLPFWLITSPSCSLLASIWISNVSFKFG